MDSNNLDEYISLIVDATVKSGLTRQMEAFRAGFNQVSNSFLSVAISLVLCSLLQILPCIFWDVDCTSDVSFIYVALVLVNWFYCHSVLVVKG